MLPFSPMLKVRRLPGHLASARPVAGRLLTTACLLGLAACADVPDVSDRINADAPEAAWPSLLPQSDLLPATTVDSAAEAARQQDLLARAEVLLAKPSLSASERAELRGILAALETQA